MDEPQLILLNTPDVLGVSLAWRNTLFNSWRMKMGTYKLDGVFDKVAGYQDVSLLANSVHPVNCLSLHHWIPLRLHNMDII